MRAIIIAAGRAKRMGYLSDNLPKCLLQVNGKTVLAHQIDALRVSEINDIVVIKGYKKDLIDYPGIRYRINANYMNNNILNSLFCAEEDIGGDVLITYGDVLFKPSIVNKLFNTKGDFVIAVEDGWRSRYHEREAHPLSEAENVVMDSQRRLIEIGKILNDKDSANAEFIGMLKLSASGAQVLKKVFREVELKFSGKPFQRAVTFEQAYLTDMLQELADRDYVLPCVDAAGDWAEIDTPQDYQFAQKMFR
jgi:choline kinase